MNTQAKKQAINKVWKLDDYFFTMKARDQMSNGEYEWIRDHLVTVVSSLENFENIDGLYDNLKEEIETQ